MIIINKTKIKNHKRVIKSQRKNEKMIKNMNLSISTKKQIKLIKSEF